MLPVAAFAVSEAPDAGPRAESVLKGRQTVVHALEGIVYVRAGENDWVLTPGDSATVPAGVPYRRWNAGDHEARWVEVHCATYS